MNLTQLHKEFRGFPKAYSLAPLWYWNDELHEDELARQLDEMRRRHVNEAMIFPMAGLQTRVLSEAYFEAFRFTLREAKKRGMRIWIYDEYCWPSGVAGGRIHAEYPEYLMRAGRFYRYPVEARASREVCIELPPGRLVWAAAERRSDGKRVELLEACDDFALRWRAERGAWDIRVCVVHPVQFSLEAVTAARWSHHLPGYVDTMNREAMAKYIEMVYEGHYRAAPEYFGTVMPGFFTDEPDLCYDMRIRGGRAEIFANWHTGFPGADSPWGGPLPAQGYPDNPALHGFVRSVPWTRDLLKLFRDRRGYDLRPHLGELAKKEGADRKVCFDYFELVSDCFADAYAGQIGAWCARHKVWLTGHYVEHVNGGDYYRQVKPLQAPGIDLLGGRGSVESLILLPRRAASIARMQGRERVMAETYGATPWNLELAEKVQAADLLTVLGINLHAPIDYAYSFRGFRKHTANPPGFYQTPGWAYQQYFSDHTARMCRALSAGRSAVSVGLIYGSSAGVSNSLVDPEANARMEHDLKRAFLAFTHAQIETDVVHETGLADGRLKGGKLVYPGAAYATLALPPLTILREDSVKRLIRFVREGGTLLILGEWPAAGPRGEKLAAAWRPLTGGQDPAAGEKIVERRHGRGRWIFVPDFTRMIGVSKPVASGEQSHLFDGTDSLLCIKPDYPFTISVDLGQKRVLSAFSMQIEEIKQAIIYDYELQVSNDGRRWKTVAAFERAGRVHEADLGGVQAKQFRVHVRSASDPVRMFGLTDLSLRYRDASGATVRWEPPHAGTTPFQDLLPDARPALTFQEAGAPARALLGAERALGADRIQAVVNRAGTDRTLTGQVRGDYVLEAWDADTGRAGRVDLCDGQCTLSLAPYESKLFVLRKGADAPRRPVISLERPGAASDESTGPWPFRPMRANAFPLAAGRLRMADPAHPDRWHPVEAGRIPEALRLVNVLRFDCEMDVAWRSGEEELLVETGVYTHLAVNGRPVPDAALHTNRYVGAFGQSARIGSLLKRGKNRITGWYMPEMFERTAQGAFYCWPLLQPTLDACLLGPFAVRAGRLVKPPEKLDARPWQEQGFPYYSGTGCYTVRLPRKRGARMWLETDARNGVVDVRRGDEPVGVRLAPPYRFEITGAMANDGRAMEIRITNTLGSLFSAVRIGSLVAGNLSHASGLERVRWIG